MSTFFIVRNKHTNEWLPVSHQRNSTAARLTSTLPPRLFRTVSAAKNALNWWCEGIHYMNRGAYGDDWDLDFVRVPDRKKEDMEVVGVILEPYSLEKNEYEIRMTRCLA